MAMVVTAIEIKVIQWPGGAPCSRTFSVCILSSGLLVIQIISSPSVFFTCTALTDMLVFDIAGFVTHNPVFQCFILIFCQHRDKIHLEVKEALNVLQTFILHIHTDIHTTDKLTQPFSHIDNLLATYPALEMSIWIEPNTRVVNKHGSVLNSLIFFSLTILIPPEPCVCAGHGHGDPRKAGVWLHQ